VSFELPYSIEVFFSVAESYNADWFPAAIIGWLAMVMAVALSQRAPRITGLILGGVWVWIGLVHQIQTMADFNFMARVYGWAWIAQGVGFAVLGGVLSRLSFQVSKAAVVCVLGGLIVYPLSVLAYGYSWSAVPLAGTMPNPTVLVTAGLLLAMRGPKVWLAALCVVPLAWGIVAGISAYLLGFPLDYTVPIAMVAAALLRAWR